MALIAEEKFDGNGSPLTTENTSFGYVGGTPARTAGLHGDGAMECTIGVTATPAYGQIWLPSTTNTAYQRFYIKLGSIGTTFYMCQLFATTVQVATLSVQSDGGLRMRQGTGTTIGVTSTPLKLSTTQWTRVEWGVTGTTMQLRMFTGANLEGSKPDYDSGAIGWTAATFNRCGVGTTAAVANVNLTVDEYAVDDSAWVGSAYPQEPAEPVTHSRFRFNGVSWVPCVTVRL